MNRKKIYIITLLILSLFLSVIPYTPSSSKVSAPKLSKKKIHIKPGNKRTISVKSPVAGTVYVRSLNPSFADVTKKTAKRKVKKNKPASFTVQGKCAGYAIFSIVIKLKKPVKKKREYERRLHVYIDELATPKPTVRPTATPKATASPKRTSTPRPTATVKPTATPSPTPVPTALPTASPTPSPTPLPTNTPSPTPDIYNYTVTFSSGSDNDDVTGMPEQLVVKVPKDGDCSLTLPPAPSREGYIFDGWIYKNDYIRSAGTVVAIDKDMTIRPRWLRCTGPIIDYLPGEAGYENIRGLPAGKMIYGSSLTVTDKIPSWEGHSFTGWCVQGYYEVLYWAGDVIKGIYSNINLVAQWDTPVSEYILPSDETQTLPEVTAVYDRMIAKKEEYPEDSEFSKYIEYTLYGNRVHFIGRGPSAFVYILFDAAFESINKVGKGKPYTTLGGIGTEELKTYVIKVGDILEYSKEGVWDNQHVIVLDTEGDEFTVAEANDGIVHWNSKLAKDMKLICVYTRWE